MLISPPFGSSGIPSAYEKAREEMEKNQNPYPTPYNKKNHSKTKKGKYHKQKSKDSPTESYNNVFRAQLKELQSKKNTGKPPTPLKLRRMPEYPDKLGGKSRKRRNKRSIKSKPNKRKTFRKKRVHRK